MAQRGAARRGSRAGREGAVRGGAVVTGAGSGVGKQLARLLVQPEHLVLVTDVNGDAARGTAAELGPQAVPRNVDVRDHRQLEAARDEIVALAGSLDVWVNNAGVLLTWPAWAQDADARWLMLEVNALGTINGTVAAIEAMPPAAAATSSTSPLSQRSRRCQARPSRPPQSTPSSVSA